MLQLYSLDINNRTHAYVATHLVDHIKRQPNEASY